jgi:hypothetical protein
VRFTGVEPSAHSGGPFSTRSSPTRSTEDGDSHIDPCRCRQGRAWAGDEEADTRNIDEVVCPCGASPALVLLPTAMAVCGSEQLGRELVRVGEKGSGWPTSSIL